MNMVEFIGNQWYVSKDNESICLLFLFDIIVNTFPLPKVKYTQRLD